MTVGAEEAADDRDKVIAAFQHELAGNQAGAPFVYIVAAAFAIGGDIFLEDAKDDRANARPDAGARAHGTRLVGGIEDEVGKIAAVPA